MRPTGMPSDDSVCRRTQLLPRQYAAAHLAPHARLRRGNLGNGLRHALGDAPGRRPGVHRRPVSRRQLATPTSASTSAAASAGATTTSSPASPRIFGVSVWYDGEDTELDNYFNQLGVSFERLGQLIDLRLNANIPLEDTKQGDDVTLHRRRDLHRQLPRPKHARDSPTSPLRVVDFEVAPRIFNLNAWVYGGGYQMDGDGISEFGAKGGVRGYVTNDLAVDVGVTDDDVFGTNTVVQVIWTPGRTAPGRRRGRTRSTTGCASRSTATRTSRPTQTQTPAPST